MIRYVALNVQIHGLNDESPEIVRKKVEDLLVEALKPDYRSNIEVTVEEFAGEPA